MRTRVGGRVTVDVELVGRDEPLERVGRFVEAVAERPGRLAIEGPPGIGKTSIWQAALDMAAERGYDLLVSHPSEAETALAHSGLADLLAAVEPSHFETLPDPQRHAIEVALLLSEPGERPPEPRTIFAAFGGVLLSLARERPVLVAIDDRQWLDRSSAKAVDYAWRRLGPSPVGLLATERSAAARPPPAEADVLRLGPLSPGALHRLINARVGVSLPRPTILRLHRTTEGNPFFALELARWLVVAGLPGAGEPWPVPDDLQDIVAARVGRLSKSVRSALLAAAASSRPTITDLSSPAIRAAERAEVVAVDERGRVRFAHPLVAAAVYASATGEARRAVHAALAAAAGDIEEQARHSALACAGTDAEVAELLDRAAANANARGAPDVAAELQDRAAALTPLDQGQRAWLRAVDAAEYYLRGGDLEHAHTELVELVRAPGEHTGRSRVLRLLGEVCYRLRYLDDALEHLRQAMAAPGADRASATRAEIDLAYALTYSFGSFEAASAAARHALGAAESLDDDALLASALAAVAVTDLTLGKGLDEEKLSRALLLEDDDQPVLVEQRPSFLAGWAYLVTEQLDRARAVFESLRERLIAHGEESDLPDVLALLARVECLAGNLARAADIADEGYELACQAGSETLGASTKAMRAVVDAQAGRIDETRAAAAEAIELAERSGWRFAAFWASTALAQLDLALGNYEAVVATLGHSIALVEEQGVGEPSRRPFLPDAIEALVQLGDHDRADRLTAQLERQGRELDRPWAIVAGARCRALVLAAQGDVAAALAHLERVPAEQLPLAMPLELARTLIVKGQLERRLKKKQAARGSLESALALCEEIGATLWAARARSELARVAATREQGELTPTEARVAALAAAGLTNREIAAAAFMSQKTVEANLSRIYRKLAIRSRAELGVRLAEASSGQPGSR